MSLEKLDEKWTWFIVGVALGLANIFLAVATSLEILYPSIYYWLFIIVGVLVLVHYLLLSKTNLDEKVGLPILFTYIIIMPILIILGFPLHCTSC